MNTIADELGLSLVFKYANFLCNFEL